MDTSEVELKEPTRFGPARRLLADLAYPSNEATQWLSDVILANGHEADVRPTGSVPVRYNYPRPQSQVPSIFEQTAARRIFRHEDTCLVQQFCDGVHWHNLALVGPERVMYYWEPTGSKLGGRDAISTAFECAAPGGWDIVSIPLRLQADGHSCGDWAHWFRCRVHEYVADETQMGKCTFPEFLRGDLLNLRGLRGTQLTDAESRHRRFARRRRDALRELLRDAARRGARPWGEAQLDAFVPGAQQQERTVVDLNTLDEELDGDRRVMIDLRSPRSREIG